MILVLQIASVILTFATFTSALPKARDDEGMDPSQLDGNSFKNQKTMHSEEPMHSPFTSASMNEPYEYDSNKGPSGKVEYSKEIKPLTMENEETFTADDDYGFMVAIQSTIDAQNAHEHKIIKRGVKGSEISPLHERRRFPAFPGSNTGGSTKNVGQEEKGNSSSSQGNGTKSSSDERNTISIVGGRPVDIKVLKKKGEDSSDEEADSDRRIFSVNSQLSSLACPVCDCSDEREVKKSDASLLSRSRELSERK